MISRAVRPILVKPMDARGDFVREIEVDAAGVTRSTFPRIFRRDAVEDLEGDEKKTRVFLRGGRFVDLAGCPDEVARRLGLAADREKEESDD